MDDDADDDGETVELEFDTSLLPSGMTVGSPATATVTLTDDDTVAGAPSVSTVALTSDPGPDAIYALGNEIKATVRFDKSVTGAPQLGLTVGSGTPRQMTHRGGGGEVLTFVYTVADGDSDTDGVSIAADSLSGTIRDSANQGAGLTHAAVYRAAFPLAFPEENARLRCNGWCTGYELLGDLDFFDIDGDGQVDTDDDTNGDGQVAANDTTWWNGGAGWEPIGGIVLGQFRGTFEGNGHTIRHLFINRPAADQVGLFGQVGSFGSRSSIRAVGVIEVDVTGNDYVGGLVGWNSGEVGGSYVTGRVSGKENVGGLVGINHSTAAIRGSYATSRVSGEDDVGGLIGDNRGAITAGYATGRVSGDSDAGGLVGLNEGVITDSYWDTRTSGHTMGSSGEGKTTAELQAPTGYSGIYADWNVDLDDDGVADDPWHFGTAGQYPVLSADVGGDGEATWQEFGYQLREGPTLTATAGSTQVALTWTAVDASLWMPAPSVTYTVYRDDGATVEAIAENRTGLSFTDTDVTADKTYTYQVAAVVAGGEATRSALTTIEPPLPNMWLSPTASDPVASVRSAATYSVTFQGTWTTAVTSGGLPSGAHFTTLIGGVHNAGVTFLSEGGMASAGVESMAELGGTSTLATEVNRAKPNALTVLQGSGGNIGPTGSSTINPVTLTTDHPRVTLLSMVAPSPDWFVGVSGLSLLDAQGEWLASRALNLYPWDAGTEEGTEFSLSNAATSPQGVITSLRGTGKFSNAPIATLTFTRQSINTAPSITSDTSFEVDENQTAVATLQATDDDTASDQLTWSIPSGDGGGADAHHFVLSSTGVLAFSTAKDYENPDDAGADRTYEVRVQVSDGANPVEADLIVRLLDVDDAAPTVNSLAITSNPGTDQTYAADDEIQVTVTFSETVEVTGRPRLRLELGGGTRTATYEGGSGTAALVIAYKVADGESDMDGVGVEADSLTGGTIRDEARNNAELDHDGLAASGGAVVNGTTLKLTYDEPLDGSSTPEVGDFTATVTPWTDRVAHNYTLTLVLGEGEVRSSAGNKPNEEAMLEIRVAPPGVTEPISSIGLSASAGNGEVRLSWNQPSDNGGSAILRYEYRFAAAGEEWGGWKSVGSEARGVTVGDLVNGREYVFEVRAVNALGKGGAETARATPRPPPPGGENASGTTVTGLFNGTTYRFQVRAVNALGDGRESDAAGVRMPLDPSYPSNFRAEDLAGGEATLEQTPIAGSTRSLRVTFGAGLRFEETLSDQEGEPAATRSGSYGYQYRSRRTGRLRLDYDDGISCELRLTFTGLGEGRYSYGCSGGERGLGTFRLTPPNRSPEITGAGPFEVLENRTEVTRLTAADTDAEDGIRGYGIGGGADGALFMIVEETGALSFREPPDFEPPADVGSSDPESGAGDNEYVLVVQVTSGEGERERMAAAIAVRVTDEEEPPGTPAVTAEGTDSLRVSWTEPDNTGPPITDYDVHFREGGSGGFTEAQHEGTERTATLAGLSADTVYQVQVQAVNEEGMSEWSEPGEGRTDPEEPDPDDSSNFTSEDLEGRRLRLEESGEDGTTRSLEVRFGAGLRFEQIEPIRETGTSADGTENGTTEAGGTISRSGSYAYRNTGPQEGRLGLDYDDGVSCEIRLAFSGTGVGTYSYDCSDGDRGEGSFRLTTGSPFVPVILSSAGRNDSFFTSELTLTNRGLREVRLDYSYRARIGGGSGTASEVLGAGRQKIEPDALAYLRRLGIPIPETGNRLGTLRVEVGMGSEVGVVVRTTTAVPDGRAGLAYPGIPEEEGFEEAVYLCGLRQNGQDRSNVAFQNMGTPEEGAITLRTTVFSGEAGDPGPRVLKEATLGPGGFHQYSGLLGVLGSVDGNRHGYVKVERVGGRAPFYAYGVINDQSNSDGSFVFPVTASSSAGTMGQTLPVIVETGVFASELTVTNFSDEARTLQFSFVADGVRTPDHTADFSLMPMRLEAGEQRIIPDIVVALRQQGVEGIGPSRGGYAGPLFATEAGGDLSGVVIGARTGAPGGGGQYSVFYNAVPVGAAFSEVAWVDGLQQNEENRSNLALVNTGEVDGSDSVFSLEIYDGETGLLVTTIATQPIPARGWHQINGILGDYAPGTRQGYVRIRKLSGQNPFLAYGVVNDGGAPGQRSGDGAYVPARE